MKKRPAMIAVGWLCILAPLAAADLVAYYPLDTDANDASGNGHHGTVIGTGVTFGQAGANAATGSSTDFAGSGHIDVPYNPALNTPDFTVALWANADVAGGTNFRSPITNRDDVGGGVEKQGWIIYNDNNGNWNFWNGSGTGAGNGWHQLNGGAVATTTWTHLAISYESATFTKTFYINGAPLTSIVGFSPNGSQMEDLHIGGGGDDGLGFRFDGRIDDVGLFNTALTQPEIMDIMNNGVIPEPSAAALLMLGAALIATTRKTRNR